MAKEPPGFDRPPVEWLNPFQANPHAELVSRELLVSALALGVILAAIAVGTAVLIGWL